MTYSEVYGLGQKVGWLLYGGLLLLILFLIFSLFLKGAKKSAENGMRIVSIVLLVLTLPLLFTSWFVVFGVLQWWIPSVLAKIGGVLAVAWFLWHLYSEDPNFFMYLRGSRSSYKRPVKQVRSGKEETR